MALKDRPWGLKPQPERNGVTEALKIPERWSGEREGSRGRRREKGEGRRKTLASAMSFPSGSSGNRSGFQPCRYRRDGWSEDTVPDPTELATSSPK